MYQVVEFDFTKISQSWFHMMMFYFSLRLDIALGVLRDSHRDQWPTYWYRNLVMDMEMAGWLLSAYSARQSVPPPVPRRWIDMLHCGTEDIMARLIQESERFDRETLASPRIRDLLPFWRHNDGWPSFGMDNTWWLYPLRKYRKDDIHTTDKLFKRAFNFFNGMWPEEASPLHEVRGLPFRIVMDGLHAELQTNLRKVEETEVEMWEAWVQVQRLAEGNQSDV